jgi:hypothetical protein
MVEAGFAPEAVEETLLEFAGGYRVTPAVALLVGARWVDLSSGLQYAGPIAGGSVDASKSWVDPFVGAHLAAPLSKRWWLGVHGDVGGFGVGSELAWQAYADLGFRPSELVSLILGYRVIDMDYEEGSGIEHFHYDLQIDGPISGGVPVLKLVPGRGIRGPGMLKVRLRMEFVRRRQTRPFRLLLVGRTSPGRPGAVPPALRYGRRQRDLRRVGGRLVCHLTPTFRTILAVMESPRSRSWRLTKSPPAGFDRERPWATAIRTAERARGN